MKFNMGNSARDAPRWAFKPEEAVYGVWEGLFQDIGVLWDMESAFSTNYACNWAIV